MGWIRARVGYDITEGNTGTPLGCGEKGVPITHYFGDTVVLAYSQEEALRSGELAVGIFHNLGFMISKDRSVITQPLPLNIWSLD